MSLWVVVSRDGRPLPNCGGRRADMIGTESAEQAAAYFTGLFGLIGGMDWRDVDGPPSHETILGRAGYELHDTDDCQGECPEHREYLDALHADDLYEAAKERAAK